MLRLCIPHAMRFRVSSLRVMYMISFSPCPWRMQVVSIHMSDQISFHSPSLWRVMCPPIMKHWGISGRTRCIVIRYVQPVSHVVVQVSRGKEMWHHLLYCPKVELPVSLVSASRTIIMMKTHFIMFWVLILLKDILSSAPSISSLSVLICIFWRKQVYWH